MPTNQEIVAIFRKSKTENEFLDNFHSHYPTLMPSVERYHQLYTKARRVADRMKSSCKSKAKDYGCHEFEVPQIVDAPTLVTQNMKLKRKMDSLEQQASTLKRSQKELEGQMKTNITEAHKESLALKAEIKNTKGKNTILQKNVAALEKTCLKKEEDYQHVKFKLSKEKQKSKNMGLASKSLKAKLGRRDEKNAELTKKVENLRKSLENQAGVLECVRVERSKLVRKLRAAERMIDTATHEDCTYLEEYVRLSEEVKTLERENKELSQLVALLEDEEVATFADGRYSNELRETIMELLSMNVSMAKMNKVIRTVLRNLAGKTVSQLPSKGTLCQMIKEANLLSKAQVGEAMLDSNLESGNCLHGDGTTKFHRHYQSFQVTTSSGRQYTFGLDEMVGSDTAQTLKTFTNMITNVTEAVSHGQTNDTTFAKLITSIKHTMSDQGSVNPCFNRELVLIKEELLPKAMEHWSDMPQQAKEDMKAISNYYCKMHLLVNFASECDSMLKIMDQTMDPNPTDQFTLSTSESVPARLIRTVVKAFHPQGSDECGVAGYFLPHLQGKDKPLKLISYRGNRFNVLFYDAAATYFHLDDINSFLASWPNPNRLLCAVKEDLAKKHVLAGVRALGILNKIVTGPFWRLINAKPSILDLNKELAELHENLLVWSKNASSIVSEPELPFSGAELHKDVLYEALFRPHDEEMDFLTKQSLELMLHGILLIIERQACDQLPGGKYANPTPEQLKKSKHVPTSNVVSERDFAMLDMLVRSKPSADVSTLEAMIMWMHNKTSSWLQSKSKKERDTLLENARKGVQSFRKAVQQTKIQHKNERQEALRKKQLEKEDKEKRDYTKKVNATNSISKVLAPGEVLMCLSSTELWSQINFHKTVLKANGPKELFYKTKVFNQKRISLTTEELQKNLTAILQCNQTNSDEFTQPDNSTIDDLERDLQQKKNQLWDKLLKGRLKNAISREKQKVPFYTRHPERLCGKKVEHLCRGPEQEEQWFSGTIDSIHTQNDDPLKTLFNIIYEESPEEIWNFNLISDLKKGDLKIKD